MPTPGWKMWRRIVVASIVVLAVAYGVYLFQWMTSTQEDVAEADRLDPGWRLAELEQKRETIHDQENGALVVLRVAGLWQVKTDDTQQDFWSEEGMEQAIINLPPEIQLSADQRESLKKELEKASPAMKEARQLVQLRRGRFPNIEPEERRQRALQESRRVATLLQLDSILKAQDRQADEAFAIAWGILNCGRSIGDEPGFISQIVRMNCDMLAVRQLERVLAQGEAPDQSLRFAQELLQDEASQPLFLHGVRGERAENFEKMGTMSGLFMQFQFRQLFRLQTQCVEAAKAPPEKQLSRLQEIKPLASKLDPLTSLWLPSYEKVVRIFLRNQALIRCAGVALAVERFRMSHGGWPDSLAALVPEFLPELPVDPYNGSPLKFRRLAEGVVVYSVGQDGEDNGGKLDRHNPISPGTDLGFQLWDVAHRRQPWRPVMPKGPNEPKK